MWLSPFFSDPFWEDAAASAITFTTFVLWLLAMHELVYQRVMGHPLCNKLLHISTGPIFVLCWNLFSAQPALPRVAAVGVLNAFLTPFLLTGQELVHPEPLGPNRRKGNLYGPVFYGITFNFVTALFWRHSPVGILALMVLCGGDGLAEVVGRRFCSAKDQKLPWAPTKSWPGTIAMFLGSFLFGFSFVAFFDLCGNFEPRLDLLMTAAVILAISAVAAVVESVCWEHWDNLVLPILVLGLGQWALPLMYKGGQPLWSTT